MTTISWTAGTSGAWSDAANWSPAVVPGDGDDVVIDAAGAYAISVANVTVHSIRMNSPSGALLANGALTVAGELMIGSGTLDIVTGTVVGLGTFSNTGTVVDDGSLVLFGPYTAADIARIGGTGSLDLGGSLVNAGATLDGSGLAHLRIIALGTVAGGTVIGLARPGAATLDDVTWRGILDVGADHLRVLDTLSLTAVDGGGPGMLALNGGTVTFSGSNAFDHASVAGRGTILTDGTLALGAAVHITFAEFGFSDLGGTHPFSGLISNAGTIEVIGQKQFAGDQGVVARIDVTNFDNLGTIATGGSGGLASDAIITVISNAITNRPSALIAANGGRVITGNATVLTNDGTILADAGTVQVGGLLQGSGRIDVADGGVVEFDGAVAPTQSIDVLNNGTLLLQQPGFVMGTISGFAPGDVIKLGVAATPLSYSNGDLKLLTDQSQTLDLHILGPYSLANFSVSSSGVLQVNGVSDKAPVVANLGSLPSYPANGAAVVLAPGLTITDTDSPVLIGATIAITAGAFAGDILSADTKGSVIVSNFDAEHGVLTLAGSASLAAYQEVLETVGFSSGAVDPTDRTTRLTRTITWVVNDGSITSAPVTSMLAVQPPARTLEWTGAAGVSAADAGNWRDVGNALDPALLAPGVLDTLQFTHGGGAIAGAATVAAMTFGGGGIWQLDAGGALASLGAVRIAGADFGLLAVTAGGTLTAGELTIAQDADGVLVVQGTGSQVDVVGSLVVGEAASAGLSILSGATVRAQNAAIGIGPDATGNVDIEGVGSHLDIVNELNIGMSGVGVLTLGNGTELTVINVLNIGTSGVLNSFGGVIDPAVVNNTGRAGGKGQISASVSIVNSGTLFAAGGTETLIAPIITSTGVLEIDGGGNLAVNVGSVVATQTVTFTDGTGVLTIGTLGGFAATIGSFLSGDSIVVPGTTIATSHFDSGTHLLTLFDASGSVAGTLRFGPSITSGSSIVVNGVAPCFMAGTRISTERGEVCVEDLMVGDAVQVAAREAGTARITWLGHRSVDCTRHPRPQDVWPVRISVHAFGPSRPARDLWLSPDHALYIDRVLIPVKHLINGSTIVQVPVASVTYYHVELPYHAILLAENLPAESYLDTGDRMNFANAAGPVALHPDFASRTWDAAGCAPLIVTGPQVAASRRWLQALAA